MACSNTDCVIGKVGGVVFIKNRVSSRRGLVFVGGLGDSILSNYVPDLMWYGEKNDLEVVSVGLRSFPHYGMHLIDDDVEDVESVYRHCGMERYEKVFIMGHSTGCQVLMLYSALKNIKNAVFILQGPVSDREYEEAGNSRLEEQLEVARQTEGVLPFKRDGEYVLARRFLDLFEKNGKEDFFSIGSETSHLNPYFVPTYAILSENDEYAVAPVEKVREQIGKIKGMKKVYVAPASHTFLGNENCLISIIEEITKKLEG